MIPRKTFPVDEFRKTMNQRIRDSHCSPEERRVMCSILEMILMDAGQYRGFRYLEVEVVGGEVYTLGDETRREYLA